VLDVGLVRITIPTQRVPAVLTQVFERFARQKWLNLTTVNEPYRHVEYSPSLTGRHLICAVGKAALITYTCLTMVYQLQRFLIGGVGVEPSCFFLLVLM
jgi:hypothetical protein